jgi:alginate O-acetyltransferase complex protein AlgJ
MLKYLQSDELKNATPQLVIWEFPERYLPMANDLSNFDPAWIAELKSNSSKQRLASSNSH